MARLRRGGRIKTISRKHQKKENTITCAKFNPWIFIGCSVFHWKDPKPWIGQKLVTGSLCSIHTFSVQLYNKN